MTRPAPRLAGLGPPRVVYCVPSYPPEPAHPGVVAATATYGLPFAAVVRSGRIVGTQFHPERSGQAGLRLLANFVGECAA